jgi:hypothetical protein
MAFNEQTEMSAAETDALLGRHETGVLALARDSDPYAIPISYGFDRAERQCYLRLVSTPESEKRTFLASSPATRLVVYEQTETTYRSAVVIGTLEKIDPDHLTPETIEQYGRAKRPLFEIWGESKRDLDIELYRLVPDEISGRRIEVERDDA